MLADKWQRPVGAKGHFAGIVFRRLAALAVDQAEHVAGGFPEQFLGAQLQQALGDRVQEHGLPLGVGHQHGFGQGGERLD